MAALQTAIKEMERSRAALEEAKKSPDKLSTALAAEQSAYQALLLKAIPREFQVSRSRSQVRAVKARVCSQQRPTSRASRNLISWTLSSENNSRLSEPSGRRTSRRKPTLQQNEQAQTVDRLKQLARRQQDLNDRMRDLQTALTEARTDQAREEAQRQLKRLQDEERQMLADVDEMRQQMEQSANASQQGDARQQTGQSPNAGQQAGTRQQLEQNAQRGAAGRRSRWKIKSVSEALAGLPGSRAEENLQNVRENLRQQSSSQFAQQMRQMQEPGERGLWRRTSWRRLRSDFGEVE